MMKNNNKKARKKKSSPSKQKKSFDKNGVSQAGIIRKPGNTTLNKTGSWRSFKPVRDEKKCSKCMLCWQFCPDMAIKKNLKFDYDYCKGCGICAKVCPLKCIEMKLEEK